MAYQSLYRKYRPQTFADVVGQGAVVRTLQNALSSGRLAHGFLFTGTRGTAKTTVARLLAKAVNCLSADHPVPEPCNACAACLEITAGSCIDVVEIDAASHRGVADIEEVRKAVGYGPMQYRCKVFIIDEAHQLSSDAKDAFLKTLEEPPPGVVFILATTEPQAIPITIRSRCQQFDFKRGSLADITGRLKFVLRSEGVTFTDDAVTLVARGAEGSYRDSLSLLEQVLAFEPETLDAAAVQSVLGSLGRETLARITECVASRDAPGALALAGEILDSGKEARSLLKALSAHLRDLMLVRVGGPAASHELSVDEVGRLQEQARHFSPQQLLKAIDIVNEALGETRWNNQHRLLTELTFLKLMGLGAAGENDFQSAPIVFDAPKAVPVAPAPKPIAAPKAIKEIPAPAPEPIALVKPEKIEIEDTSLDPGDEALPPGFFASDEADDEDHFVPLTLDEETALIGAPAMVEKAAIDDEPALFDEPDESSLDPIPGALTGGSEDAPAAPAPGPNNGEHSLEDSSPSLAEGERKRGTNAQEGENSPAPRYTLEDVQRAWPTFLSRAGEASKRASVMMSAAMPTAVEGPTIVFAFSAQAPFEMMNQPKGQEFVRKLLAMVLGAGESVPVRFELHVEETMAMKFERAAEKPRVRHDPLSRLRALESADTLPPAPEIPQVVAERQAPWPARPSPEPVRTEPVRAAAPIPKAPPASSVTPVGAANPVGAVNPWSVRHDGAAAQDPALAARRDAALAEPLVQDALSIFGGDIVVE